MDKLELINTFDTLQQKYGSVNRNCVYGGGLEQNPKLCLVFINPTAKNIATNKNWNGIRCQWLGTKQIWKFLTACGLFDEELNSRIQNMKPNDWTPEFCEEVYLEVKKKKLYITNLAKCTQEDARKMPDEVFKAYKNLLFDELDLVNPEKVILFGNQISSIILDKKISVSQCRKQSFELKTLKNKFECFPVYYPVGNGFYNTPYAIEDIKYIKSL